MLTAVKSPAVPFDTARLDRLMDDAGMDVLLATSKHNVQYLLGGHRAFFFDYMDAFGISRYLPVVVYPKGAPEKSLYVAHRMEGQQLAVKPLWEFAKLGSGLSEQGWRSVADHMAASRHADVLGSWIVQATRLFGFVCSQGIDISPQARAHAEATIAHAGAPDWLRRGYFLADQLRFGFAKETLAVRYRLGEAEVSLATVGRHLLFLARRYRGRMLRRLTGGGDRPS